jgi:microcystin-dependent protein
MEAFIGSIILFAGNFAPNGWQLCQGQLLPISQNAALFSLLGTFYGGNGVSTFALPDLRGRVPVGQGQGPGLSSYDIGEVGGVENVTLLSTQMPAHNHLVNASNTAADQGAPGGNFLAEIVDAVSGAATPIYTATSNAQMNPTAISLAGGNQPHQNLSPFLCLNYIICLNGIYPSRS